jgi:PKD repeat protein
MVMPKIIIQGDDQHKATKWIPWAIKKLSILKSLPGLGIVNNSFRPSPDVDVRVKSVNGLDTIRIKTSGGEYSCEFPSVAACTPCSDFQLRCPSPAGNHNEIGFTMRTDTGYWDNFHWDFGDGEVFDGGDFTGGWSLEHEYDKPGKYTVSVTATRGIVTTTQNGVALSDGVYKYGRSRDPGASNALAHADYVAATPSGGFFSGVSHREIATVGTFGVREWEYESMETNRRFDLTAIDPLASVELWVQNLSFFDSGLHVPTNGLPYTFAIGTGLQSSLGGSITGVSGSPSSQIIEGSGIMNDLIGSIVDVRFSDIGGNAIYTDVMPDVTHPITWANIFGWSVSQSLASFFLKIQTPGESATTTKEIRVNSGRPKKTRQTGESVHT